MWKEWLASWKEKAKQTTAQQEADQVLLNLRCICDPGKLMDLLLLLGFFFVVLA